MVATKSLCVALVAAACSDAFMTPVSMKLGGGSRTVIKSTPLSLSRFFKGQNKSSGGGGNGGINGGSNGKGGSSRGYSQDDDSFDARGVIGFMGAGVLGDIWASYNEILEEQPILTKACTSLVGFSIGDTLAQKFVNKGEKFDRKRLARMAAFGFLFHGTISHFFYKQLDSMMPGTDAITIAKKVFTDQVLWAPIFTFIYLTYMGLTSGLSPAAIYDKIKNDLVKGVVGSWTVWPIVHSVGFKFVPTEQRLLYINCIQIGYNIFLSVLGSNKTPAPVLKDGGLKKPVAKAIKK